MNFWKRIKLLLRANISEIISKAKKPEQALGRLIEKLRQNLSTIEEQLGAEQRECERLQHLILEDKSEADRWDKKAVAALKRTKDTELCKEAIRRKLEHTKSYKLLELQAKQHEQNLRRFKVLADALRTKIEEVCRQKELLVARQQLINAQRAVAEFTGSEVLERIEDALLQAEAEAEVATDWEVGYLRRQFEDLEKSEKIELGIEEEIQKELRRLKQRLMRELRGGQTTRKGSSTKSR